MMYMINVLVCEIIASVDYCFSLLETMANALVLLSYVLFNYYYVVLLFLNYLMLLTCLSIWNCLLWS